MLQRPSSSARDRADATKSDVDVVCLRVQVISRSCYVLPDSCDFDGKIGYGTCRPKHNKTTAYLFRHHPPVHRHYHEKRKQCGE